MEARVHVRRRALVAIVRMAVLAAVACSFLNASRADAASPPAPINPTGSTRVHYYKSRDGRYIFIKSPAQLLANDEGQREALRAAIGRVKGQLDELRAGSPRTGLRGKITQTMIDEAARFDQSIDDLISYMQKYYGQTTSLKLANWGTPSGFLFYSGFDWNMNFGISAGGSFVLGLVLVPLRVIQIEVDTGKSVEYSEWDMSLVVWPTANLGLGAGLGLNSNLKPRLGGGIIWGLDRAEDFTGFAYGASASVTAGIGLSGKLQALKNFKKPGAVSSVFLMGGWDKGAADFEVHGNLGYIVDATGFFNAANSAANLSPEQIAASMAAAAIDKSQTKVTNVTP